MTDDAGYRAWKEATFGTEYMIWHDGLPTNAVTGLAGDAREEALRMLRVGVALGDAHAAQALAAMGDVASLEAMRDRLASSEGSAKVATALAIHRLAPEPRLADALVHVLRSAPSWSTRIDAAIGLRHFGGAADEEALLEAVARDPDYLVRYHASESLLSRWRIRPRAISEHEAIFERIRGPREGRPSPTDFAGFEEARSMLAAMRR